MKHTECKDCKLRNGDCGHHFKMNGKTNYDIPSLTACDRYGNCEFFQQKEKLQGDLISRRVLNDIWELYKRYHRVGTNFYEFGVALKDIIDNAPTVEQEVYIHGEDYNFFIRGYKEGRKDFDRPKGEWNYIQAGMCVCPFCGATPHKEYKDFCPKCGADMRKGENNEKL